jgi:hypothetical protein
MVQTMDTERWYYLERETPVGRFMCERLLDLFKAHIIGPHTYVWREGTPEWICLADTVRRQQTAPAPPPISAPTSSLLELFGATPLPPTLLRQIDQSLLNRIRRRYRIMLVVHLPGEAYVVSAPSRPLGTSCHSYRQPSSMLLAIVQENQWISGLWFETRPLRLLRTALTLGYLAC